MDMMNKALMRDKYAQEQMAGQAGVLSARQPNLTEQLEFRLEHHRAEAAKLEEAIAAVKKNPEIEHLLNLLQRL